MLILAHNKIESTRGVERLYSLASLVLSFNAIAELDEAREPRRMPPTLSSSQAADAKRSPRL